MTGYRSGHTLPMSVPVRFDELVLKIPGDELRVKFHPRMTVLSGLGAPEREALAQSIVGALAGGAESTAMRYVDGTGRLVNVLAGPDGPVRARHEDDGSPAAPPMSGPRPRQLRSLMLVQAADLGVVSRTPAPTNRPSSAMPAPRSRRSPRSSRRPWARSRLRAVRAELEALDEQLRQAHDGAARREYAEVLAQLERVRAEAATLQSGTAGVDADRHLLANATLHGSSPSAGAPPPRSWRSRSSASAMPSGSTRGPRRRPPRCPSRAPTTSAADRAADDAQANRAALDNRLQVSPSPSCPLRRPPGR